MSVTPSKMLLQHSFHNQNVSLSLSSSLSYSATLPSFKPSTVTLPHTESTCFRGLSVTCSVSRTRSSGTVGYKRRPIETWNAICRRISLIENPEVDSSTVLNKWEDQGKWLTKLDLCKVIKELRKYKRHKRALEVKFNVKI